MARSVRQKMELPFEMFGHCFSYLDPSDVLGFRGANHENRLLCAQLAWKQHKPVHYFWNWHRSFPLATFHTLELDKFECAGFTLQNPECVATLRGISKLTLHDADSFFIPRNLCAVIQGVETLNLGCYVMRYEDLPYLCTSCLKHLSLYDCVVYDEWFLFFGRLETLVVNNATFITDAALHHLHSVRTLVLHGASNITDAGLAHLNRVQTLVLHGATHISDVGLARLNVETFALSYSPFVSNQGIAGLGKVRSLGVTGCHYVTERAFQALDMRPTYYSVKVHGRTGVGFIAEPNAWVGLPHGWKFAPLNLVNL